MRISDWSSDVCSSDLTLVITTGARHLRTISKSGSKRGLLSWVRRLTAGGAGREPSGSASDSASPRRAIQASKSAGVRALIEGKEPIEPARQPADRKRGVSGQSGSVRGDLGGRR